MPHAGARGGFAESGIRTIRRVMDEHMVQAPGAAIPFRYGRCDGWPGHTASPTRTHGPGG